MDIQEIEVLCESLLGSQPDMPFDDVHLTYKVGGKMYLLTDLQRHPLSLTMKCDPQRAIDLCESYSTIHPGFHMNKKHWITLSDVNTLPRNLVESLVRDSYELVLAGLPQRTRAEIESLKGASEIPPTREMPS